MALRLPQWDTVENNAIRTQLLGELANAYQRAIRIAAGRLTEGKLYGQQVVEEWGRNLQRHVTESQGQFFKPALDAFLHYFGWLLGSNLSHTVASSATGPVPAYLFSATS
ncbi:hypothetical protein BJ085DRAFT_23509 [Dimargaris cristalligena]|uniref:Tethering factor for nuclear proteasome STS1 n=1 Tax=Dimargaris cristalligena TaxID=215637 RepID=A0A4P9ZWK3_9FUNG|nr:hypothetical protein BJ085DRAFT_23509 [Dimargaris cristalligena]|eukprot:RKP37242.1 hypothetical protein BJ085DRAFT_23509 [Dimargaris cristalligena]